MVATVAILMAITYWPNLRRLYLKVNPFTGEPNGSHSVVIPIVGLYDLFLIRDALLKAAVRPVLPNRFTRGRVLWSLAFIVGGGLCYLLGPRFVPSQAGTRIEVIFTDDPQLAISVRAESK